MSDPAQRPTTNDAEAVAWQMRVDRGNGAWFAWDHIDQDEYDLYLRFPTKGVEVRALYAGPTVRYSHD